MIGQRLPDGFEPTLDALAALGLKTTPRGAYWKASSGTFYCLTPNGRLGNLASHVVLEFPDGTITVSPSILIPAGKTVDDDYKQIDLPAWHGYIEEGVWRSV